MRAQEGLDCRKGFIGEEFDTDIEIVENGVKYFVDVKDGQKTGFFWTRNITVVRSENFAGVRGYWIVLPTQVLLH